MTHHVFSGVSVKPVIKLVTKPPPKWVAENDIRLLIQSSLQNVSLGVWCKKVRVMSISLINTSTLHLYADVCAFNYGNQVTTYLPTAKVISFSKHSLWRYCTEKAHTDHRSCSTSQNNSIRVLPTQTDTFCGHSALKPMTMRH